ncbi:MAG: response regulator transcription factor [Jatrophihabitans sp.]|nr:MAG: response regulator transcription factor [Jatrophihabitans sp.]
MARVAIVEDHALVADMLAGALTARGIDAAVVPIPASPVPALLARITGTGAELVLLDLDLGGGRNAVDLVAPLAAAGCRVLVVSGLDDPVTLGRAWEAGAVGVQHKREGFAALLDTATAALQGIGVLDEMGRARMLADLRRHRAREASDLAPFEHLTEREREVLVALADGRSVSDIASSWTVSDTTVRAHVRGILTKLGTSSQLGAVAKALRAGWLERYRAAAARRAVG